MDTHTSTAITPAPSSPKLTANSVVEWYIGVQVGGAAAVLLEAIDEYRDRGVTPITRDQAGEIIGELCRIRHYLAGHRDFDALAKEHGVAALRACDISLPTAEWAVARVLSIVHKVMRDRSS